METDIETLRNADLDGVAEEVAGKLRLLKALAMSLEPNEVNDLIARDLILPAVEAIGRFCTIVTIED